MSTGIKGPNRASAYTPIFNVTAPQPRAVGIQLVYRQ
jgi:hypothetical protein